MCLVRTSPDGRQEMSELSSTSISAVQQVDISVALELSATRHAEWSQSAYLRGSTLEGKRYETLAKRERALCELLRKCQAVSVLIRSQDASDLADAFEFTPVDGPDQVWSNPPF